MQERRTGGSGPYHKVGGVEGACGNVDTHRGNLQTGNPRQLVVRQRYSVNNCRDAESAARNAVDNYGVNKGEKRVPNGLIGCVECVLRIIRLECNC